MRKPGIAIVAKLLNESVRAINHRAKLPDGRCGDFIAGRIELTTTEKNALLKALAPLPAELLFGNEDEIRAIFAALPEDVRSEAVARVIRRNGDAVVDVAKAR